VADFQVNDKVVHPQYGGGYVAGIEAIAVGGDSIECLKISCVARGRKIFVPRGSVELSAIRPPLSRRRFQELRKVLGSPPEELNSNFNRRMKDVKSKLETGDPMQVGEVVRDLYPRWAGHALSSSDQRIFETGRDLLASEIALILDLSYDEATTYLEQQMANGSGSSKNTPAKTNGKTATR